MAKPREVVGNYSYLLGALVVLIVGVPVFEESTQDSLVAPLFITLVSAGGLYAVAPYRRRLIGLALTCLPLLVFSWVALATNSEVFHFLALISAGVFYGAAMIAVVYDLNTARRVTPDTIVGAVAAYLLIGVMWAVVYLIVELAVPGSIGVPNEELHAGNAFYFSFVTLTTLGYGEMLPSTALARSLATLESVMGPMYTAILVGRFLGLYVAQEQSRAARDETE